MNIDFTKLQIFYYLVILKDYTKVSEHLDVSISKVKFAIAQLEKKHQKEFFQRDGKVKITTFRLTAEGLVLFDNLKPIFDNFPYQQEKDLIAGVNTKEARVDFRTTHGFMKFLLPGLLKEAPEKLVQSISISQNASYDYTSDVYSYKKNIPDIILSNKKIENQMFVNEHLGFMKFNFYASKSFVELNVDIDGKTKQKDFYLFSPADLTHFASDLPLDKIHYIQNFDYLISVCSRGLGIVLLPEIYAKNNFHQVCPTLGHEISIFLAYNRNQYTKNNFQLILNAIRKQILHQG